MQAYVFDRLGAGDIQEVPRPEIGPDDVLIAVDRVQLSVTECALFRGEEGIGYEAITDRIERGQGRLFGHEFCGTVEAVGGAVTDVQAGDRVFSTGTVACGTCVYCERQSRELCTDREIIGMDRPGALAEFVALPASAVWTLPDSVSDAEGAALQPFATSLIDVLDSGLSAGDDVAIFGAGVIGNGIGQFALANGARRVFAVDVNPDMVALANEYGMCGVDASETDPIAYVERELGGIGPDVVFEAVGGPQNHLTEGDDPVAQAYRLVRPGGTLALVGHIPGEISLRPLSLTRKSVSIVSGLDIAGAISTGPGGDTAELAISLVAEARVTLDEFITHELDGLDSVEDAVEITLDKERFGARGPAQIHL